MKELCFVTDDGRSVYCSKIIEVRAVEEKLFEITAVVFCGVYGQEKEEMTFLVDKWGLIVGINGLIMETPTSAPTAKNTPENSDLLGEEEEI
jgi:hypothetical protein